MKRLQWLKIKVGFYSDPRVVRMLRQSNGETYHLVLSVLRDFAGAINHGGWVYVTEQEPLTSTDLGHYLHRRTKTMEKALDCLEELEFIRRTDTGSIQLLDWEDMQGCDKDQARREQTRQRVAKCRRRQREITELLPPPAAALDGVKAPAIDSEAAGMDQAANDTEDAGISDVPPLVTNRVAVTVSPARWQDHACIQQYRQYFGQIGADCAHQLLELERYWGAGSLSNAIDIAYEHHAPHVKYIQAVLVNGNGTSQRKESKENERIQRYAAMLESCVRESDESVESVCGDSTKITSDGPVGGAW